MQEEEVIEQLSRSAEKLTMLYQGHLSAMTFEESLRLLRDPQVVADAKGCLTSMAKSFFHWNPESRKISLYHVERATSTFLAAHLMMAHPNNVMDQMMDDESKVVFNTSLKLTQVFGTLVDILLYQPSAAKKERLTEMSIIFIDALIDNHIKLQTWKVIDPMHLIQKIKAALQLLLRALLDASRDHEVINEQDPIIIRVREQMCLLREKLKRLGGHEELSSFDHMLSEEMQVRRMLFSLRQEHSRLYEKDQALFDFIEG